MYKKANPINLIGGHILQNVVGKTMLRNPGLGLRQIILRSAANPDQPMRTPAGALLFGIGKGGLPELGSLRDEFRHYGTTLANSLQRSGVRPENLTARDMVALRAAMAGDFLKAFQSRSPHGRELVLAIVEALGSGGKTLKFGGLDMRKFVDAVQSGAISKKQAQRVLEDVGRVVKENKLTGNLIKEWSRPGGKIANPRLNAVYKKVKDIPLVGNTLRPLATRRTKDGLDHLIEALEPAKTPRLNKVLEGVGDAAASGALAVTDPGMLLFNKIKWAGSAPVMKKTRLGKLVQDNVTDVFFNRPMEKSFEAGLKGDRVVPFDAALAVAQITKSKNRRKLLSDYSKEMGDSIIMNPFLSATKDLANGVGSAIHNAKIDVKKLRAVPEAANEMVGVAAKQPSTPAKKTILRRAFDAVFDDAPLFTKNKFLEKTRGLRSRFSKGE